MRNSAWTHLTAVYHWRILTRSPEKKQRKCRRQCKVLVVAPGGGFLIQVASILRMSPPDVDLLVVGPPEIESRLRSELSGRTFRFRQVPYGRRQRRQRSLLGSVPDLIAGTFSAIKLTHQERPAGVVGVGQRASLYFLIAARLFGIPSVFVECITRVTKASATASLIARLRLADHIYVQWPQTTRVLPGSVFRGRLV